MKRVAIIGTAGRDEAAKKRLTKDVFAQMVAKAKSIIIDEWKLDAKQVVLVSGGSAWCDHVAVDLYLHSPEFKHSSLELYMPCAFNEQKSAFQDEKSWHNCGHTLNQLHAAFGAAIDRNTLQDVTDAKARGATIDCSCRGFLARNIKVGKSDYVIAFSNSSPNAKQPTDGGTAHTWGHSSAPTAHKKHVPLASLSPRPPNTNTIPSMFGQKRKFLK